MINHLDLCSGIGGFALGFEWAKLSRPIAFFDTEKFCQKVLEKNFPNVPIYSDVKELANDPNKFIQKPVGILSGGYPCQPFSTSGKRKGEEDPRHIFPYIHEIVKQIRPSYCVFENVYGHISLGLDEVLLRMEDINYHTRAFVISAASVGARHKRDRVFIICKNLGNSYYDGLTATTIRGGNQEASTRPQKGKETSKQFEGASRSQNNVNVPNTDNQGIWPCINGTDNEVQKACRERTHDRERGTSNDERSNIEATKDGGMEVSNTDTWSSETLIQWQQSVLRETIERWKTSRSDNEDVSDRGRCEAQCRLDGVANGISYWMDEPRGVPRITIDQQDRVNRLKGLGNAIVPHHAYHIGLAIKEDVMGEIK